MCESNPDLSCSARDSENSANTAHAAHAAHAVHTPEGSSSTQLKALSTHPTGVAGGSEHSFVEVVDDGWQRRPYLLQIHNAGIESVGLWGSAAAGQEQQKQQQQQQQQYSLEGVGTAKPQDGSNYAKHSQYMQQHARHAQRMQASPKRGGGASGGRGWDGGSDTFQVTDQQCRREDYKGLLQQDAG